VGQRDSVRRELNSQWARGRRLRRERNLRSHCALDVGQPYINGIDVVAEGYHVIGKRAARETTCNGPFMRRIIVHGMRLCSTCLEQESSVTPVW
jgi:hypothetical protein